MTEIVLCQGSAKRSPQPRDYYAMFYMLSSWPAENRFSAQPEELAPQNQQDYAFQRRLSLRMIYPKATNPGIIKSKQLELAHLAQSHV